MQYQYPLHLSFKIISFGPQIRIADAAGREVFFVHMKAFKLKEDVTVFSNESRSQQLFRIQADRVIDFSATYTFTDASGNVVGKVQREGMRSIFKASYLLKDLSDQLTHKITEDNAWIRVADALIESIPIVGMAAGYLFHPSYTAADVSTGSELMRLTKEPAFFEGKFRIDALAEIADPRLESRLLLSYLMMILLERQRG